MVLMKSSLIFRQLAKKYDMPEEDIQSLQSLNNDFSNLFSTIEKSLSSIEEVQNLLLPKEDEQCIKACEKLSETEEILQKSLDRFDKDYEAE